MSLKYNIKYFDKYFLNQCEKRKYSFKLISSQKKLLEALAAGNTIRQIAIDLNCSFESIKKRTRNLYKKFNVNNRSGLIDTAIKYKFLSYKQVSKKFRKRFFKNEININSDIKIPEDFKGLDEKELNILCLAAIGCTRKQIIKILGFFNEYELFCHCYEINKKLNAVNMTNAVCIALKLGLI